MRRLRVLGPLEVEGAAAELGPRDRVVVSALALRPGERVDAELLAEALWGEEPPASAAKVVQGCVSRLRRALGSDAIETVAGGYRVRTDHLDIDRQQFEDLVTRAREHLVTRTPERAITMLTDALALWRGPAFGELEDWMPGQLEAVRLGQLRLSAEEDLLQAKLDAGDHQAVAADATVLTGQQPFRERRWALLALAQYRSDRQADALASIRAARRALGQELGLDPGSELVALEQRILAQDASLAADHESRLADRTCPWKGLSSYDDRDEETFFGRTADVVACLSKLEESRLLVVTGPSGSGKSSLVQAGLVPALRRSGEQVEVMTPGTDGALAMAAALNRGLGDPVLVVDQLEEAFTLGNPAFARPWLGDLARYAEDRSPVVLVIRGDHLAALGADVHLARLVERGLHLVAPLSGHRLREAIEGPATVSGLRLEPGLVDLMVRDADGQPGALPLLSHALTETWQRRETGLLTVDAYHAVGGIRDAVAASAERLYDGLTDAEQAQLRWPMLHLVSLSESGEPYRTPMSGAAAAGLDPVRLRLLDLLVRGRLVTSYSDGYDVAHEALVRAWPRLRGWLDEDRAGQQIRRHLTIAAAGWDALDRPDTELYRGARLAAVLDWLERGDEPLTQTERAFVQASRSIADEEVRRLEAEARRQQVLNRRLRMLVAVASSLLLVGTIAGVVAVNRGREARTRRDEAQKAAVADAHKSLVARSLGLRSTNLDVAAMLAVVAWRQNPDALAESALLGTLTAEPGFLGYRLADLSAGPAAAAVPGTARVLVANGTAVQLLDPGSAGLSQAFGRVLTGNGAASELSVSADGSRAVQLLTLRSQPSCNSGCHMLVVDDLLDRKALTSAVSVPFAATDVAISDDGSLVAAAGIGGSRWDTATWDASTGRPLAHARVGGVSAAFGHDDHLFVGTHGRIHELAPRSLRPLRSWPSPAGSADVGLAVAGSDLVAAGRSGQVVFDLENRVRKWTSADGCTTVAVSEGLQRVYCGTSQGPVEERDLVTGHVTGRVFDAQIGVGDMLITRGAGGGDELFLQGTDQPLYARWRLDGPGIGGRLLAPGGVSAAGYDPSGRYVLVTRGKRTEVIDDGGRTVLVLPVPGRPVWLSSGTLGVAGREPQLISVRSGRVTPLHVGRVDALFPDSDGRAWAVSEADDTVDVKAFSLSSGAPAPPRLDSLNNATDAQVVSDPSRVLVTTREARSVDPGPWWSTTEYDAETGEKLATGLHGMSRIALDRTGAILGGSDSGNVALFSSGVFPDPDAEFPRVGASVSSVQVSDSGERAVVTSGDHMVDVVDRDTRMLLGGPIPTDSPAGVVGAWLRPDGGALLTNTRDGVVVWNLRPQDMANAACALAGRNPMFGEWSTYVGDATPYVELCPEYPTAEEQVDQTQ